MSGRTAQHDSGVGAHVDLDTRVIRTVCAGEADGGIGDAVPIAGDVELDAGHIELGVP